MPAAEERPYIPKRHVHLDFHTGPAVPDVGSAFDPATFAQPFVDAGVDSVTVFGKCHHGHLYWATDHQARHPALPSGLDLLGEQIEALHRVGIKAPIYLSVQCDEYAADTHPDWIALGPDLRQVKFTPEATAAAYTPGWQILDMSSPYADFLADQLDEVLRRFAPVDGIFLDMCWDQPSSSRWAKDGMRKAGLDPTDEADRGRYARQVAHTYMGRYRDMIRAAHERSRPASIFFNSRPRTLAGAEAEFATHSEIEALPTGGWGYSYTPFTGRFVRSTGLPTFGMTGRFHFSWGDNAALKPAAALKYECCQLLALGFGSSVGDLLHPRSVPHPATYRLIGEVYHHLAACEPYVEGGAVRTDIAMLVTPHTGPWRARDSGPDRAQIGAVRILQQLRQQFDVVEPGADLGAYRVVVVPESTRLDERARQALRAYVAGGGAALVVGAAALPEDRSATHGTNGAATASGGAVDEAVPGHGAGGTGSAGSTGGAGSAGTPGGAGSGVLLPELGITVQGWSPYTHTFLRVGAELAADAGSAAEFDTVVYDRGLRMSPTGAATSLASVVEPYFERSYDRFSGHDYTAPDRASAYSAIVENTIGTGRVITVAEPLFEAFARYGNVAYPEMIGACLARLLPEPLVRAGGPAHMETSVVDTASSRVVHLLSFLPARAGVDLDLVTDPFPLVDVPVAVRRASAPRTVTLQPHGRELGFEYRDGYVHVRVDLTDGHGLLVLD